MTWVTLTSHPQYSIKPFCVLALHTLYTAGGDEDDRGGAYGIMKMAVVLLMKIRRE